MKFGLFYLFTDFGNIPQDQIFDEVLEEIEYGEELGFDSVWLPEHHFAVYGMLGNPMTLAADLRLLGRMVRPDNHACRRRCPGLSDHPGGDDNSCAAGSGTRKYHPGRGVDRLG